MDLTSKTYLAEDEGDKSKFSKSVINPAMSLSKTKHFSLLGMELTCDVGADVRKKCFSASEELSVRNCAVNETHNPQKIISHVSRNSNIAGDRKKIQDLPKSAYLSSENHNYVANNTQHFTSDPMEFTSTIYSDEEKKTDSVQSFAKTKYFSSCGMELTCNLQNENMVEQSSSISQTKRLKSMDNESNYIETNTGKCIDIQNCEKNDSQLTVGEICSINTDSILAEVEKLQCSSKSFEKSNMQHTDCSLTATRIANGDLQKQTLTLSTSCKTPNPTVDTNIINKSLNSPKRNYNEDDVDANDENKLFKATKFSDCDIVYAIKQVKGMNQASANDYNIFKFPEVFFSLKKNIIPKTSFSCSRIQLTKTVQDAIRRSSSFSYATSEQTLIEDFKKKYMVSSSKSDELTKLDRNTGKNSDESDAPVSKKSAHSNILSNSQILDSTSSCKTIKKSLFIEYCQSPRQNVSINNHELTKQCSLINSSPDTINCFRSLNAEREITCSVPSLIISRVHEESIIEDTRTSIAVAEDIVPDGPEFCLDNCSISLVPNDDTLDSVSLKFDSETFKKLNFTRCINEPLAPLNEFHLKISEKVSDSPCVSEIQKNRSTISETNSWVKSNCDIEFEEMNEECMPEGNITDKICVPIVPPSVQHFFANNKRKFSEGYDENSLKDKCAVEKVDTDKGCKMISNEEKENHKSKCKFKSPFSSKTNVMSFEKTASENHNISKSQDCLYQMEKTHSLCEENGLNKNKRSPCKISNISDSNKVKNFAERKQYINSCTNDLQATEKVKEILINEAVKTVKLDTFPENPAQCSDEFIKSYNKHEKVNKLVSSASNKNSEQNTNENNVNDTCNSNSLSLIKIQIQNVCQDTIIEKVTYASEQSCSTNVINEVVMQVSERRGSDLAKTFISNQLNEVRELNDQISTPSHTENCVALEIQEPPILRNTNMVNEEVEEDLVLSKLKQSCTTSPLTSSKQPKKQIVKSSTLSMASQNSIIAKECETALPVTSKNSELITRIQSENCNDNLEKNASDILPKENINKNLCCKDMDVENLSTLQDNLAENEEYFSFERIHILRKKIMAASQNANYLWDLRKVDDKQAVFEILYESIFACYLMYADLQLTPKTILCTNISFKHLKEEPDERDELGFSLFKCLISNEKEMFPFPADDLPDKLTKIVDFALSAKSLISDIWCVAIRNVISIDNSSDLPKLYVKILNENYFSHFLLKFSIDVKSYPKEKIIPEVKHLEFNPLEKEIILAALNKVEPGKKYLSNMAKVANALYSDVTSM